MATRPGRRCGICLHQHLAAINSALAAGRPQASIADEFKISRDALSRHYLRHMPLLTADGADHPPREPDGEVDLITSVADLRTRLAAILKKAEAKRDLRGAILCIREASRLLELHGKLTGELDASGVKIAIVNGADNRSTAAIRERILAKLAAIAGDDQDPALAGRVIEIVPEDDAAQ